MEIGLPLFSLAYYGLKLPDCWRVPIGWGRIVGGNSGGGPGDARFRETRGSGSRGVGKLLAACQRLGTIGGLFKNKVLFLFEWLVILCPAKTAAFGGPYRGTPKT